MKFKPDQAVANLSSIVMLIEVFGRKILLTGDQRGDHVLDGLIKTKKAKGGKLHVDVLKVPHHGAIGNNPKEFVAAVTADTYVFSANGKDQNPDPPVLALYAAEAKKDRKFTMAFTNGAMVYEKDRKGKLPKIGKTTVKTLKEAIAELKKDPREEERHLPVPRSEEALAGVHARSQAIGGGHASTRNADRWRKTDLVGLCLSGGGYRAMLFHAGAIVRMNELGLLRKLDRVSSVSGGSMTAAALALAYPKFQ